jgi:hypothetical protein
MMVADRARSIDLRPVTSRARRSVLPTLAITLLLVACGGSDVTGTPHMDDRCKSIATECIAKQQGCVDDAAVLRCEPCEEGKYAAPSGRCEAIPGKRISNDFAEFTVQSGEEVLDLCQSWTVNNAEELWVNAVEMKQDVASHHSNWTFVPDNLFAGPDGVWPCKDRNYRQLNAALSGGVLYAQSTQTAKEVQKFPGGVAVRIPPYARIIGDVHLLNTSAASITGHVRLSLHTLPAAEVAVKLVPFHLTYDGLNIPPRASSRFTGECAVSEQFPGAMLAMKVHYILPHTHAMAKRFFLNVLGGPRDGESIIEVKGFTSEAHGLAYNPPIEMLGASGYRFGCEYDNPRAEPVGWGFGDQEMCELLGFADSPYGFESRIATAESAGTDGDVRLFTGPCSTIAFPWTHDKPGGPGPQ